MVNIEIIPTAVNYSDSSNIKESILNTLNKLESVSKIRFLYLSKLKNKGSLIIADVIIFLEI